VTPLDQQALGRAVAGAPEWLADRRRTGFEHFEKLEMPSEREENWRYIDLDFDIRDLRMPDGPGVLADGPGLIADLGTPAGTAAIIDGHVTQIAGGGPALLTSSSRAASDHEEASRHSLAIGIDPDIDLFAAAHRAFSADGAFLHVPARVAVEGPIVVDIGATTARTVSFPHLTIVAGESSQVSVVVRFHSPDGVDPVVVPQIEVVGMDNATVKLTTIQNWGDATRAFGHQRLVAGADTSIHFAEAGIGGRLSRLHLMVDLEGRGSRAEVLGAYFGHRDQILDYRYFMRHAGLNTASDMFLKGAVEDEALSVFTGMIRIEEEAQKTDAFQTNRNLILSDGAAAQSVPNLEILANDVRCGHGSTVGPLDPEQRYYLTSRGLSEERADRLQVTGFFNEALARFPEPAIADRVADAITAKYVAAQEEGRV
jgi:Fe-S cluster assembly protein SufD